ncbi:MAG: DUF4932 domain-containing protein [Bryobacteraceae bacterium]
MRGYSPAILLAFLLCSAAELRAQAYRVGVDPRVELMSVLFRLAGNDEYNQCRVPGYDKALESYFAPYRNHEAVQLARSLQTGFDAPMNLAVQVKDVESLAERVPFDRPGSRLAKSWNVAKAREFLAAARKFVADTKFTEFLKSQQPLYDETNARLRTFVEKKADLAWYSRFFGTRSPVRFIVVPGMANGGPSYGASFVGDDGVEEMYAIPGVSQVDSSGLPQFAGGWMDTMVHEFVHSFSNPLVDRVAPQMEKAARQIYAPVQAAMERQAYGDWKALLYESMVRAATIQYVLEHDGPDAARRSIQEENSRSFYWMGDLCDLLGVYKNSRQKYPTLESFMPRVVEFFNDAAPRLGELTKRYDDSRPKVVSMSVHDGALDVDPALTEIVVRFNQPMSTVDLNKDPRFRTGRFDQSGTALTIPVVLEPEHDYQFSLSWPNGQNLTSADGVPLQPVLLHFRTKVASAEHQP